MINLTLNHIILFIIHKRIKSILRSLFLITKIALINRINKVYVKLSEIKMMM